MAGTYARAQGNSLGGGGGGGGGTGDVVGPGSAVDNAIARFDGTTGKLIQNSLGILDDSGVMTGLTQISMATLSLLDSGKSLSLVGSTSGSKNLFLSGSDGFSVAYRTANSNASGLTGFIAQSSNSSTLYHSGTTFNPGLALLTSDQGLLGTTGANGLLIYTQSAGANCNINFGIQGFNASNLALSLKPNSVEVSYNFSAAKQVIVGDVNVFSASTLVDFGASATGILSGSSQIGQLISYRTSASSSWKANHTSLQNNGMVSPGSGIANSVSVDTSGWGEIRGYYCDMTNFPLSTVGSAAFTDSGGAAEDYFIFQNDFSFPSQLNGELRMENIAKGLEFKAGSNARVGTATLVAGTVTVSNTSVTANSLILVTTQSAGGTVGGTYVTNKSAGVGFDIKSTSVLDTSVVAYLIIESR